MADSFTGLKKTLTSTELICDGEFEARWKPFDSPPQVNDAIKLAYMRGRRDQRADTARTLRDIFGLKG